MQEQPYEILEQTKRGGLIDSLLTHITFGHIGLETKIKTHDWYNYAGYLKLRKQLRPIVKHQIIFR